MNPDFSYENMSVKNVFKLPYSMRLKVDYEYVYTDIYVRNMIKNNTESNKWDWNNDTYTYFRPIVK
jgi:hypothetical protein